MADPYFFGYGSLVNTATHDFPEPRPATLSGWRRVWRHTDLRPVAFLTAIPDPTCAIQGLIAHVPNDDWEALDEREWAYDRISVTHATEHPVIREVEIAVYSVPEHRQSAPDTQHPILLSYLDVVVQGYARVFGPEGVDHFFATTGGWDAPILDDRAAPRYPRHQPMGTDEHALVDEYLMRLGAQTFQLT
ncbi:gamma-glutamylcyclotransferase [Phaeobacter gallaeciensis]|uniref:Gamma-glutamylcyclotransferase n=2 Tax=Roseobacteraceae TaxID=2854170 RepID=A0A366WLV8_9RHOB|nr:MULTISPECIES: gamma-glutamylcyclotransferase family protein [Roseobacteraceae]MBT3141574.1 gamma-glutamylcyclotransferase [Falsiruegeria litorea]MBT8167285.1 gamma-glutamylcyclotransferase [Falsiruegeria litorea]RBW50860.1 gamma-glutamylcyclotransferase [Phaeobacter gallaeciensis]